MIKFGLTSDFILKPLTFYLETRQLKHPFELDVHTPEENVQKLLRGELDLAVISPLEYALHSSELKIFSPLGVVSNRESRVALLFFQENLPSFNTVMFPLPKDIYYHLTRIALMEFYEMEIEWKGVPQMPPEVQTALESCDAALYTRNTALDAYVQYDTRLDMVEEWCDKSAVPFVHLMIVSRQDAKITPALEWIEKSFELGRRNILAIAEHFARDRENPASYYFEILQEQYHYELQPEEHNGLKELFNYLYYYGVTDFLPELHWM